MTWELFQRELYYAFGERGTVVYYFNPLLSRSILIITHQQPRAFESIVEKGEIARNEQIKSNQIQLKSDNCIPICPYS